MHKPSVMFWYQVSNLPVAVIGEETYIRVFDHFNYHDIRAHLIQDMILDRVLREHITNNRFKSLQFVLAQEEIDSVYIAEDLDIILDAMYEETYEATLKEF